MDRELLVSHFSQMNDRLLRIEEKLDALAEFKGQMTEVAQTVATKASNKVLMRVAIVTAALTTLGTEIANYFHK